MRNANPTPLLSLLLLSTLAFSGLSAEAAELPRFDFTRAEMARAWRPSRHAADLSVTPEGLAVRITGEDPYLMGPPADYPAGLPLWAIVRLRSETGGTMQVFHYARHADEQFSARAHVEAGPWQEVRLALPALGPGHHLRIDPPGRSGTVVLASIRFEPRPQIAAPAWPAPQAPKVEAGSPTVRSGSVTLAHETGVFGSFVVAVDGAPFAAGFNRPLVGYLLDDKAHFLDLHARAKVTVTAGGGGAVAARAVAADAHGATWTFEQRFTPAPQGEAIEVEARVTVDRDREAVFVPMVLLTPGAAPASFGKAKTQAIFAGLEYLDKDEPSSSEADLVGPQSKRHVPDALKITFPLMTVAHEGRYLALTWEPAAHVAALFDSPDRTFDGGGHVMGLVLPGSDGFNRDAAGVLPQMPLKLTAGKAVAARATIVGGRGDGALPAVRRYVELRGLPPVPETGLDLAGYVRLASAGWLDSKVRVDDTYRHAWPGPFGAHAAADVAYHLDWLAARAPDPALAGRLSKAAGGAIGKVAPASYNASGIGHVKYPVEALVYGHVFENLRQAQAAGRGAARRFEADGTLRYRPGEIDYGKTHFEPHANGLAAPVVCGVLEAAALTGDAQLRADGLRLLKALDRYAHTAPRGAQTWEVPLHTPDVLASAYLVRAYVLGYQLTGDEALLASARQWAWSGVPFIYLVNPAGKAVGPYAGIAVFGATHWKAPNWMGLPVQWCALVYADSLYRLAGLDAKEGATWKRLADGITASGIQQTFPVGSDADRAGLLPDSFGLRAQSRHDASINPGTAQACAARLLTGVPMYEFHAFDAGRPGQLLVHAPGAIREARADAASGRRSFKVVPALPARPVRVLIVHGRGARAPAVKVNGAAPAADAVEHDPAGGWMTVRIAGETTVEVGGE